MTRASMRSPNNLLRNLRLQRLSPSGSGRPLSRQELADAVNARLHTNGYKTACIDANYIGKLERGYIRWPTAAVRGAFSAVLEATNEAAIGFYIVRGTQSHTLPEAGSRLDQPTSAAQNNKGEDGRNTDWPLDQEIADTGEMTRRELLHLLTTAGVLISSPSTSDLDWERIAGALSEDGVVDAVTLDQYEALNGSLWQTFGRSESKADVASLVDTQLAAITRALRLSHPYNYHRRLCILAADLLQLRGEIAFDANQYDDAARCYSLACAAGKEAGEFDLWACAMTRYAYISVFERSYVNACDMLTAATRLADNGDSALSTRHWVQSVRAQALAGLGLFDECQRALDAADTVRGLTGTVHNGGWLRFDGSRTTEERATCYVALRRPDLAEPLLQHALNSRLSIRRRGSVLTDLAVVGAQHRDVARVVFYGAAALDTERQSRSGVLKQKLRTLNLHLTPFGADPHISHLRQQVATTLTSAT